VRLSGTAHDPDLSVTGASPTVQGCYFALLRLPLFLKQNTWNTDSYFLFADHHTDNFSSVLPFPDTLEKIAKALNVQIHELFWEGRRTLSNKERDFTNLVVKEMLIAQKVAADSVISKYLD